jgi:hypothetical protein
MKILALLLFTIYTIIWELGVWSMMYLTVIIDDKSAWWLLLGVFLSVSQLTLHSFDRELHLEYLKSKHKTEKMRGKQWVLR